MAAPSVTTTAPPIGSTGLGDLLALLRAHGVTHYRAGDLEITLDAMPRSPVAEQLGGAIAPAGEPACPCGHGAMTEHNQAGCLYGCPHEACAEKANG